MKVNLQFDTVIESIRGLVHAEHIMDREPTHVLISEDMATRFIFEYTNTTCRPEFIDIRGQLEDMIGSKIFMLDTFIVENMGDEYLRVLCVKVKNESKG